MAARQSTVLLAGDEPAAFSKRWQGIIGHRTGGPPQEAGDPAAWVTSRVTSPDDWALIARRNVLQFMNAAAHESALRRFAGQPVVIVGMMRGERLEIDTIEPAPPPERR